MIAFSYLGSAVVAVVLAFVFNADIGNAWVFLIILVVCFFLASSGASAAYLTVSEIFPMETRALAIAFFYAIGTAVGGIAGPLLFGNMIESGDRSLVAMAFCIGAGVMALGGVAEIFLGVKAEGANLEDIARPLTAEDADEAKDEVEENKSSEAGEGKVPQSRRQRLRSGPGSAGMYSPWPSVSSRDVPPEVSANEVQGIIDYVGDMQPGLRDGALPRHRCPPLGPGAFPLFGARSDQAGTHPAQSSRQTGIDCPLSGSDGTAHASTVE